MPELELCCEKEYDDILRISSEGCDGICFHIDSIYTNCDCVFLSKEKLMLLHKWINEYLGDNRVA